MGFVSRDIISCLPNSLISHILSFLPTKEAASTSVLAKRWRFLFASVTNLDFESHDDETSTSFMEFVDRVLALQGNALLSKFSLDCTAYPDLVRVNGWILNVLGRGVSELDLSLSEYSLSPKIFVSKTLVRLKLGPADDLSFSFDVKDVFLPKLKTLEIDSVVFEERGFGFVKLLAGCPMLEELVMMNIGWEDWKFCSVSVKTLKRLTFFCEDTDENPKSVSFHTPSLEYMEYSDSVADKYPKVDFSSLVEAHIGIRLTEDQSGDANFSEDSCFSEGVEEKEMVGNATEFLMGMCNVKILYLSAKALEVLTYCCEATPVFNNLIQLTIESNSEIGWDPLPGLLKNCPNLETLVLKGLVHKCNKGCGNVCCCKRPKHPCCLSSSPVKVLKILMCENYDEETMEIEQMKHFLKKMPCLEQLIVYYNTSYDPSVFELSKELQKINGIASQKCKIHVISQNLSLSSTLPCSLTMKWSTALPEEEKSWPTTPPKKEYSWYPSEDEDEYEDEDEWNWL